MDRKIILLHGPRACGKSNYARKTLIKFYHFSLAQEVKEGCHRALNIRVPYNFFEDCKNEPNFLFHDKTPREAWINYAEEFIKPLLGKDYFAKQVINQIDKLNVYSDRPVLIRDLRRQEELDALVDNLGADNIMIIYIQRDGKLGVLPADGDTLELPPAITKRTVINHTGREEEFWDDMDNIILSFLEL